MNEATAAPIVEPVRAAFDAVTEANEEAMDRAVRLETN
jgi:hypothetical protein